LRRGHDGPFETLTNVNWSRWHASFFSRRKFLNFGSSVCTCSSFAAAKLDEKNSRNIGSRHVANPEKLRNEIDQAYWTREKRKWPADVMGGHRHPSKRPTVTTELRQAILDNLLKEHEPVSHLKDEPVLEHYEDGFPKLPECLDRRPKPLLAQAFMLLSQARPARFQGDTPH
jgi:hypothetical protein